MTDRIDDL
jgi:hypothetical protein